LTSARTPVIVLAAAIASALGVALGVGLHLAFGKASNHALALPALHGQANWLAGKRRAPAFTLPDQNGQLVSLGGQRGHTAVIAFMDPLCKNECPIEGRGLGLAEQQVPRGDRPTLLIVSVNPHATPADAVAAAHKWHIAGAWRWHWLLGTPDELAPVWRSYQITVRNNGNVHSTAVYLVDKQGFERAAFVAPFLPQFMADDFRTLATARAAR
jgi:cytochrome oxidase Cu insertion factor (SCO1/SenC/PrrC family)